MCIILLKCGDTEIQPGPENILDQENCDIGSNRTISYCSLKLKSRISLMHLNIQSIKPKIDIILGTPCDFY